MTKTRRLMEKSLRLVDLVVELTDARIPASSRNPEIDRLVGVMPPEAYVQVLEQNL